MMGMASNMQLDITMVRPAITAPGVPAICKHCGAPQRQPARANMTEGDVMTMWMVACAAVCVALLAYGWLAGTGVLMWLS